MSNKSSAKKEKRLNQVIGDTLASLYNRYEITHGDVLKYLAAHSEKPKRVPVSVFRQGLSPLQGVVKWLFENKGCSFSEIAGILSRDPRTIGNTYREACKRFFGSIADEKTTYFAELSIFRNRKLSFLENLCCYLKSKYGLNYHNIALLLGKDDRTVWTVCKRAEKKKNAEN